MCVATKTVKYHPLAVASNGTRTAVGHTLDSETDVKAEFQHCNSVYLQQPDAMTSVFIVCSVGKYNLLP